MIDFGSANEAVIKGQAERGAVLISPGAGGTMNTKLLVNVAERLNSLGFLTMRWNFGYVKLGRRPSAGGKKEIPEMNEAIDLLINEYAAGKPIILVGKSFGARVSTYVASERTADISGFVFLGLPLRGASEKAKPRDWSHLAKLTGDILFITGNRDRLCDLGDLQEVQRTLTVPFESEIVPGDHSFKPKGEEQALRACVDWIDQKFAALS